MLATQGNNPNPNSTYYDFNIEKADKAMKYVKEQLKKPGNKLDCYDILALYVVKTKKLGEEYSTESQQYFLDNLDLLYLKNNERVETELNAIKQIKILNMPEFAEILGGRVVGLMSVIASSGAVQDDNVSHVDLIERVWRLGKEGKELIIDSPELVNPPLKLHGRDYFFAVMRSIPIEFNYFEKKTYSLLHSTLLSTSCALGLELLRPITIVALEKLDQIWAHRFIEQLLPGVGVSMGVTLGSANLLYNIISKHTKLEPYQVALVACLCNTPLAVGIHYLVTLGFESQFTPSTAAVIGISGSVIVSIIKAICHSDIEPEKLKTTTQQKTSNNDANHSVGNDNSNTQSAKKWRDDDLELKRDFEELSALCAGVDKRLEAFGKNKEEAVQIIRSVTKAYVDLTKEMWKEQGRSK